VAGAVGGAGEHVARGFEPQADLGLVMSKRQRDRLVQEHEKRA
jgi:hypothetical protein